MSGNWGRGGWPRFAGRVLSDVECCGDNGSKGECGNAATPQCSPGALIGVPAPGDLINGAKLVENVTLRVPDGDVALERCANAVFDVSVELVDQTLTKPARAAQRGSEFVEELCGRHACSITALIPRAKSFHSFLRPASARSPRRVSS